MGLGFAGLEIGELGFGRGLARLHRLVVDLEARIEPVLLVGYERRVDGEKAPRGRLEPVPRR